MYCYIVLYMIHDTSLPESSPKPATGQGTESDYVQTTYTRVRTYSYSVYPPLYVSKNRKEKQRGNGLERPFGEWSRWCRLSMYVQKYRIRRATYTCGSTAKSWRCRPLRRESTVGHTTRRKGGNVRNPPPSTSRRCPVTTTRPPLPLRRQSKRTKSHATE